MGESMAGLALPVPCGHLIRFICHERTREGPAHQGAVELEGSTGASRGSFHIMFGKL